MNFSHYFISRPIFATVLSVLILIVGSAAYFALPVSQYPEIAPPTISVSATYPGASAEIVASTVASPLEQSINGVEDMLYITSQSTGDGALSINVTFELGTDLDQAQVLVQNRVASATSLLPEIVQRLGITTQKRSPDLMMVIHMFSGDGSRDQLYVSNYASTQVIDRLSRIDGVGQARSIATREYSMRVWLDPERVAARGLTASEVISALSVNNVQVASGAIDQLPVAQQGAYEVSVETQGRLLEPAEFENIVIKTEDNGAQIRMRDVGRVELGALDYSTNGYLDDQAALPIAIFQSPGSNALDTANELKATMAEAAENFPPGVNYDIIYNPTEFIAQSVEAVYETLFEAVLLVVLVILVFLQSWRAAIIPILAIPISLIGTFAVMTAFGFSLNNLTLFGLVLAIGIVVDDAIVVVENVDRYIAEGLKPRDAAFKSMSEVSGALIATSLVMMAVFIPASLVSGITGQFYQQFALTIAASTAISTLVSLTLSPAMAALFLKGDLGVKTPRGLSGRVVDVLKKPFQWFARGFNYLFRKLNRGYEWAVKGLLSVSAIVLLVYAGLVFLGVTQFQKAPAGFIPDQNLGYLITVVQLPAGASLSRSDAVVQDTIDTILEHPGVDHTAGFAGFSGATFTNAPNSGTIFVVLKSFPELEAQGITIGQVVQDLNKQLFAIKKARIFAIAPPPVRGIGSAGGFKMYVQDTRGRGLRALEDAAKELVGKANQDEALSRVFTFFDNASPRLYAEIDKVKAEQLGVTPDQINDALEIYLGSSFVNDFNFLGRTFRVTAQADGEFRDDPRDIANFRTRTAGGGMMPIGSVATFKDTTGPYRVARYNLFEAAAVQGSNSPGVSTGDALGKMESLAAELPNGFSFEWTELALQQKLASNSTFLIFSLSVVMVFLVLAALYESWVLPLAVVLIVPMSLLTAISGVLFRGMDNNILTQIGLIVLVGLASKNAILIVEFAKQAEERGLSTFDAALEAARLRMRAILMTSFAFILGVVPLMIATGAGSEMRQALGTTVFFGMLGVTIFGLLMTPVFYYVCRRCADRISGSKNVRVTSEA